MTMDPGEIKLSFQQAKNKKNQMQVLAELNTCSRKEIKEILIEQGVNEDEIPKFRGPMKKSEMQNKKCEQKIPDIVIQTMEEKKNAIMNQLTELEEKMQELKKREEQLTENYADINNYLQEVVK